MKKEQKNESLLKRFNLKPPRKRKPLSPSEKNLLQEQASRYKDALKMGEVSMKSETRVFGGSALPDEPGGKHYFNEITS